MPEASNGESGSGAAPEMWRVLLINDDHTPMDFVVDLLQELFDMDHDEAVRLMLRVHNGGLGECGVYSYEVARMKVDAVMAFAREHRHPLRCVIERARSE